MPNFLPQTKEIAPRGKKLHPDKLYCFCAQPLCSAQLVFSCFLTADNFLSALSVFCEGWLCPGQSSMLFRILCFRFEIAYFLGWAQSRRAYLKAAVIATVFSWCFPLGRVSFKAKWWLWGVELDIRGYIDTRVLVLLVPVLVLVSKSWTYKNKT